MQKTKNYGQFKFIDSNRSLDEKHVQYLMNEIEKNNLLFANPIEVNGKFEVIDGQHRLFAAKNLKVDIYYIQDDRLKKEDMITLNKSKKVWSAKDYLHYYCSEGKEEYLKLKEFIDTNGISINLGVALCDQWRSHKAGIRFREGEFVFNDVFNNELIEKTKDVIGLIKSRIGNKSFLDSSIFFKSLCILISTEDIDYELLRNRIDMQLPKLSPQTNIRAYLTMFLDIYNFKMRKNQISLDMIDI